MMVPYVLVAFETRLPYPGTTLGMQPQCKHCVNRSLGGRNAATRWETQGHGMPCPTLRDRSGYGPDELCLAPASRGQRPAATGPRARPAGCDPTAEGTRNAMVSGSPRLQPVASRPCSRPTPGRAPPILALGRALLIEHLEQDRVDPVPVRRQHLCALVGGERERPSRAVIVRASIPSGPERSRAKREARPLPGRQVGVQRSQQRDGCGERHAGPSAAGWPSDAERPGRRAGPAACGRSHRSPARSRTKASACLPSSRCSPGGVARHRRGEFDDHAPERVDGLDDSRRTKAVRTPSTSSPKFSRTVSTANLGPSPATSDSPKKWAVLIRFSPTPGT